MAEVTITDLPDDATIIQGYFVWSGFDSEGRKIHGAIQYPYSEDEETNTYDSIQTIGLLAVAKENMISREVYRDYDVEDD